MRLLPFIQHFRQGVQIGTIPPELTDSLGIREGEVVLRVNGTKVTTRDELVGAIRDQYERGYREYRALILSRTSVRESTVTLPDR